MEGKSAVNVCGKYILFGINTLLVIVSSGAIALSAYVLSLREEPISSFFEFIFDWSADICFLSCWVFVISLCGLIGSLREIPEFLIVFKVLLIIAVIVELLIVLLVFLLAYVPAVQDLIYHQDTYRQAMIDYTEDIGKKEIMDTLQEQFECCGISNDDMGYKDWTVNEYYNCSDGVPQDLGLFCSIPHTCCIKPENGELQNLACGNKMASPDTDDTTRTNAIHVRGCFKGFLETVKANPLIIGIVALCVILPQLVFYKLGSDLKNQIEIQISKWKYS